MTRNRAVGAE